MKVELHFELEFCVIGFVYFPAGTFDDVDERLTSGGVTPQQERFAVHLLPFVSVHFIWEATCKPTSSKSPG